MKSPILTALVALSLTAPAARAEPPAGGRPEPQAGAPETSDKPPPPSIASFLGPQGDPGRSRSALEKAGVTYSLTYIGEILGNASGGFRRGSIYEGRLDVQLDADLEKLGGWQGATFHAQAFQIHGRGLSRYYLGNLMTVSGIEALPSTRLFELWLEQSFLAGKAALKAGQLAADSEFLTSQYGALFVNATFGWPAITGTNLPSGGPAYPLATPGARLKLTPVEGFTLLAAAFNGDPAGPGPGDPQRNDRHGLEFRLRDPAFLIGEAQLAYNQGKDAAGLPGTVKVGAWHHLGRFDDQRFDPFGLSLADPAGTGLAARLRGNGGVYAMIDQMLHRVPGTTDQGLGAFARVSANPGDRNLIDFYVDGGFTWKGLIPGRGDDTFGVGVGYARISRDARALDRDTIAFTGTAMPVRSSEALIEVTYQAQVVPGWTVQPDFQYVFRPGGNVLNPRDPSGEAIRNAAIFGLRSTIRY